MTSASLHLRLSGVYGHQQQLMKQAVELENCDKVRRVFTAVGYISLSLHTSWLYNWDL